MESCTFGLESAASAGVKTSCGGAWPQVVSRAFNFGRTKCTAMGKSRERSSLSLQSCRRLGWFWAGPFRSPPSPCRSGPPWSPFSSRDHSPSGHFERRKSQRNCSRWHPASAQSRAHAAFVTRILVVSVATVIAVAGIACDRVQTNARALPGSPGSRAGRAAASTAPPQSFTLDGTSTCDTLARLIKVPAVQLLAVARDSSLRDPMSDTPGWRRGCIIAMEDPADTAGAPMPLLEQWFTSRGWVYAPYSADGPDGEVFGYTDFHRLCVVRGSWDGGDDSDTTYVPAPGYELWVMCAPATPEDSVGYGKRHEEELDMQDALARPGSAAPSRVPFRVVAAAHLLRLRPRRRHSPSGTWPTRTRGGFRRRHSARFRRPFAKHSTDGIVPYRNCGQTPLPTTSSRVISSRPNPSTGPCCARWIGGLASWCS